MIPVSLITNQDLAEMLSLASATPPGAFIEVGVYKGGSAWHLATLGREQHRTVYLCDTFKGMPHYDESKGDSIPAGAFSDTDFYQLMDQFYGQGFGNTVQWVPGVFPESWGVEFNEPVQIAFAHLDCDQYRSVKESCEWLLPRMVPSGVIWFDDVDRLAGATRAAEELFEGKLRREYSHPYVRL